MRSIDNSFYKSKEWAECRRTYLSLHPLCEICEEKGLIVPAEIVHHKIHLTEETYKDPTIALNHDNLQSVCRECHNKIHFKKTRSSRWSFGEDGELKMRD